MGYTPVDERLKYDTAIEALRDGKHVYRESKLPMLACPHDDTDIRVVQLYNFCPSCGASVDSSNTVIPTGDDTRNSECVPL